MYMPIANTMTRLSKPNMPLMGPSPEGNCTAKPGGWQVTGGYVYQESELVMQSNGYVVCVEVSRSGEPVGGTAHRSIWQRAAGHDRSRHSRQRKRAGGIAILCSRRTTLAVAEVVILALQDQVLSHRIGEIHKRRLVVRDQRSVHIARIVEKAAAVDRADSVADVGVELLDRRKSQGHGRVLRWSVHEVPSRTKSIGPTPPAGSRRRASHAGGRPGA